MAGTGIDWDAYSTKSSDAVFNNLKRGDKGDRVTILQENLIDVGYKVGGVDGIYGGGVQRGLKKFQKDFGLPETGIYDRATAEAMAGAPEVIGQQQDPRGEADPYTKGYEGGVETRPEDFPFTEAEWNLFTEEISKIESGGKYNITGGQNNHYDGKYQMGRDAKLDAGRILGIDLGHSASEREAFRNDPELQERAFKAFTKTNYMSLMGRSEEFRNMTPRQRMGVLAYAHNQGAGGASKFLRTGEVGADSFGTKGTAYTSAVTGALKDLPEGKGGPKFIAGTDQNPKEKAKEPEKTTAVPTSPRPRPRKEFFVSK